ncbi:uncharacterized protein VSU04_013582 [Chlamydotis macqueenii]
MATEETNSGCCFRRVVSWGPVSKPSPKRTAASARTRSLAPGPAGRAGWPALRSPVEAVSSCRLGAWQVPSGEDRGCGSSSVISPGTSGRGVGCQELWFATSYDNEDCGMPSLSWLRASARGEFDPRH